MFDIVKKIVGSKNDREIKRIRSTIQQINALEPKYQALPDDAFPQQTALLKEKVANGASLDSILPDAFAAVREAAKRVRKERHFDVQLIGGVVLHQGKISEMKTGEGKTLTATAPVYLNALSGKGVHVVTVNDYLAKRDAETMGAVYKFLGLTTGIIVHGISDEERKNSYACDITYGTNNEFGFDFLRDNMKSSNEDFVQRGHNFAIVDEVDSILIDEARTPLIISGAAESSPDLFLKVNAAIPGLQKDGDYIVDEKSRVVSLTEDGISKLERRLRVENLYQPEHLDTLHQVQQALKAHVIFKKDVDYVVRDGKVIIVDEFTGRLMPGRRYSDGLHGALEAKEHVGVQNETQTLATITFQNYFRMYSKLAGMTGTADTEAVEFKKIYNLDVVVIPTNRKMVRTDYEDEVYRTAREKFNVIADEIEKAQKKGQPVLVGTVSVEKSELLSALLRKRNVAHEILNAKNHAREADIIKNAGQKGNVTISTNMAGRGTDIILGAGVADLGGLFVIGTERHESRRIDNQLRGRSGRQGDAGASKFFLSLEDDLMRIFASDRLSAIMGRLGMKEGESIVSPLVSRAIERAQRRVEEQNFSSRKHLIEYDDVMNQQRQVVYGLRNDILASENIDLDFVPHICETIISQILTAHQVDAKYNLDAFKAQVQSEFPFAIFDEKLTHTPPENFAKVISEQLTTDARKRLDVVGGDYRQRLEGYIYLQIIDRAWKNHLLAMDHLKDSVSLRGYGQRDPLQEYKKEAFKLFEMLMHRIQDEMSRSIVNATVNYAPSEDQESAQEAAPTKALEKKLEKAQEKARESSKEKLKDNMIYYGPRSNTQSREEETRSSAVQTFKRETAKVGRNDPCPCGSGKKYKKCHGADSNADSELAAET